MGRYLKDNIHGLITPTFNKAQWIIEHIDGAKIIPEPEHFQENLVAVAENDRFEAAIHVYDKHEWDRVKLPDDREVTWLIVPNAQLYFR